MAFYKAIPVLKETLAFYHMDTLSETVTNVRNKALTSPTWLVGN